MAYNVASTSTLNVHVCIHVRLRLTGSQALLAGTYGFTAPMCNWFPACTATSIGRDTFLANFSLGQTRTEPLVHLIAPGSLQAASKHLQHVAQQTVTLSDGISSAYEQQRACHPACPTCSTLLRIERDSTAFTVSPQRCHARTPAQPERKASGLRADFSLCRKQRTCFPCC